MSTVRSLGIHVLLRRHRRPRRGEASPSSDDSAAELPAGESRRSWACHGASSAMVMAVKSFWGAIIMRWAIASN